MVWKNPAQNGMDHLSTGHNENANNIEKKYFRKKQHCLAKATYEKINAQPAQSKSKNKIESKNRTVQCVHKKSQAAIPRDKLYIYVLCPNIPII